MYVRQKRHQPAWGGRQVYYRLSLALEVAGWWSYRRNTFSSEPLKIWASTYAPWILPPPIQTCNLCQPSQGWWWKRSLCNYDRDWGGSQMATCFPCHAPTVWGTFHLLSNSLAMGSPFLRGDGPSYDFILVLIHNSLADQREELGKCVMKLQRPGIWV